MSWCNCPQYYYDNNSTMACVACLYYCSTCTNYTACATCNSSKNRIFDSVNNFCICSDGYYDNGVSELCVACNYQCSTCTNGTKCLTCSLLSLRNLPSSNCPCSDGNYDNGVQLCLICSYSCFTCTNSTQCLTCESSANFRTYNSSTKLCSCLAKYFDDGLSNELCLPCSYTCATCQGTSFSCLTCNSTAHRTLSGSLCNCKQHYFDNLA